MSENRPIRVGLVGIGRAGWGMHTHELASRTDKFQIVAACDPDPERRQLMADKYACPTYADVGKLVQDPNVELVDIASLSPLHVPQALKALKAGKLVFQEKPIAMSYREVLKLQEGAASGRLFLRHNRRFEAAFMHIRELLKTGVLGTVFEVKLRRLGFQRRDDWQSVIASGGGQMLNWGPHIVDHALQFLESPVADQWSDMQCRATVGDAEDHLRIVLRGENGRVVDLEISGAAAIGEPVYLIHGTRGSLKCDEKTINLRYLDPQVALPPLAPKPGVAAIGGGFGPAEKLSFVEESIPVRTDTSPECIWDHLYAAIRLGQPFPVTFAEGLAVMRVISRAKYRSRFAGAVNHRI